MSDEGWGLRSLLLESPFTVYSYIYIYIYINHRMIISLRNFRHISIIFKVLHISVFLSSVTLTGSALKITIDFTFFYQLSFFSRVLINYRTKLLNYVSHSSGRELKLVPIEYKLVLDIRSYNGIRQFWKPLFSSIYRSCVYVHHWYCRKNGIVAEQEIARELLGKHRSKWE